MVIKDRIEQFSEDGVGFGYLGVNIVKKSPDCFEVPFRSIDDAVLDQYSVLNISSNTEELCRIHGLWRYIPVDGFTKRKEGFCLLEDARTFIIVLICQLMVYRPYLKVRVPVSMYGKYCDYFNRLWGRELALDISIDQFHKYASLKVRIRSYSEETEVASVDTSRVIPNISVSKKGLTFNFN